jgi:spore maturation protein CgeB
MVLNVNRDSMAQVGFSPPTRVFEAAGAGACVVTDEWDGIDHFFVPEKEILIAASAEDVADKLRRVDAEQASAIGLAMMTRALRDHTYSLRAQQVHVALEALFLDQREQHSSDNPLAAQRLSPLPA